ncbi:signal peptidase I [Niveibacterium umoris]|uniref:Signal peptidase I n=1 Tax=Niveibacterium umoris TaxID=1193620 RepID=A0A840BN25_9RHOO|nr:signal peptidase I [Niveibacterium umoris]MBB4014380.1 signal peptidase I [Niveibacterium umoris]
MQQLLRDNRGFIAFMLLLGLFRTAVADWNPIPSGSMRPTLLEGDVVLVNRLAYDLKVPLTDIVLAHRNAPQRGDVVTFFSPHDGTRLIKRVVGLPGDRVEMRGGMLWINEKQLGYAAPQAGDEPMLPGASRTTALRSTEDLAGHSHAVQWLPAAHAIRDFGPVTVPADEYLMLGDNRDNSGDSRYFGFVPRDKLIGRAERVLVSAAFLENWAPRFERFGLSLN